MPTEGYRSLSITEDALETLQRTHRALLARGTDSLPEDLRPKRGDDVTLSWLVKVGCLSLVERLQAAHAPRRAKSKRSSKSR